MTSARAFYVEWYANLLREIVCGRPPDLNDLAEDAHFNCPFGRWYYQQAPAELRATPAFNAVGAEHEHLHRVAARVLRELHEWHELAKRHVQTCCLVFMDLDHFKDINDRFGHHVGDEVLAGTVRFLVQYLRPYDKVFRYGGDEFLFGLPGGGISRSARR